MKSKKKIILSPEYSNNNKGKKNVIFNGDKPKKQVKTISWNYKKNELVYIKSGTAYHLDKMVSFNHVVIDDAYVLIIGDKQYKKYTVEENWFFILYKDAVLTISGKHISHI
tara:strand:+ start:616 stop:948 length:333 start_codon:yes stop_codon:yes gene_type:complete